MQHRRLLLIAMLVAGCGFAAVAQQEATAQVEESIPERVRELQRRILVDGGIRAEQAASDLFLTGVKGGVDLGPEGAHDAFLLGVLADETSKRDSRTSILNALRSNGRLRAEMACRLVLEAMDDPVADVAKQAVSSFAALDDDRGNVYRWVRNTLTVELRRARPDTPRGRQQAALIEALERMPNPIESVGVLISVLETRGARGLELRARESLQRLTAKDLEGAVDWRNWFNGAKNLSLAEWRLEVLLRRDERLRRYETAAERYFSKMLLAYQLTDPEALRRELQSALTEPDTVFGVRRVAIKELGVLGRQNEWAVNLLRSRLTQASSFEYDESRALVIEALGETGNGLVFEDVIQFLPATFHPRMRMAAASALGALQAPRGVDLLLVILEDLTAPDELLEETIGALGRIKQNPEGKVSAALVRFARTLRPQAGVNGSAVPQPSATTLLAAVARALGTLPYASANEAQPCTLLLTELVAFESGNPSADTNVRLAATTALGGVSHPDAFAPLEARLAVETEPKVRRAIADAIGQRALDDPSLVRQAMGLLARQLNDADETMRRKSHVKLEELATRPQGFADTFVGYEMLLEALGPAANPATVVSFLAGERGLPSPDALTPTQLQPANRARYHNLLAARGKAQLETTPAAALNDILLAIEGLQLGAPASPAARDLHLCKARALLRVPPPEGGPQKALAVLLPCLQAQNVIASEVPDLWAVALEAAEKMRTSEPANLNAALASLQALVSLPNTPPAVKDRLAALRGAPVPPPGPPGPGGG